ncbi:Succinyl-CoA ligase subunit alpha [Mycena chlorophos]|uniref:Succinyl-CoA ligase subunit alpha n=1 Tax=Mycena chlorophos TaxID=658473 RepID=A0A8H6WL02_MYCCL|nr:Succinyl-CoA ligase subunit alpha [Mycena chlorophos]
MYLRVRTKPNRFRNALDTHPPSPGHRFGVRYTSSQVPQRNRNPYDTTIPNLSINSHTRVIFQGFTGRQATANAIESLAWGTHIVGGVKPNFTGYHPDPALSHLPVYPTVRAAAQELKPDATAIYVAAGGAAAAIEEALEAEVPLIVAVAEHVPLHDMLRIHQMLRTQSKSRLVGANSPGIISTRGCRIGFQPLPCFSPGHVGIVAKSGTLSYEAVAALTRAGLGQSLCIGMGGDVLAGTDFVDGLELLTRDPATHGIVLIGEIGGTAEEEAAEWIREYRGVYKKPKPIAALVAGKIHVPGRAMGHAGAWLLRGESTAEDKYRALEDAGVRMVEHPSEFGVVMQELLSANALKTSWTRSNSSKTSVPSGRRTLYTAASRGPKTATRQSQSRALHITGREAEAMAEQEFKIDFVDINLKDYDQLNPETRTTNTRYLLALTIDRSARAPCIVVRQAQANGEWTNIAERFPFPFFTDTGSIHETVLAIADHLDILNPLELQPLILSLVNLFHKYESVALEVTILKRALPIDQAEQGSSELLFCDPRFTFDDAAFRSAGRHVDLHTRTGASVAEDSGIFYAKLGDEHDQAHAIGTVVNGAGLAMNTLDMLASYGKVHTSGAADAIRAANFLDTGGKATSETVKASFALLLADPRVKVIFVNVFGGLTLGDMIARGILLAFRDLGLQERGIPVVVRIRGTNEAEGQRILQESGVKGMYAFDDFGDAARKCIELAEERLRNNSV